MRPATATKLRANAATVHQLGRQHGLHSFALSTEPGELVATLDADRSYFVTTSIPACARMASNRSENFPSRSLIM